MCLKPHSDKARKFSVAARAARRHLPQHLPPLLYLSDPARTPDPIKVAQSLPIGAGFVYRHFGASDKASISSRLREITWRRHQTLLIGNDPELAMYVRADGVHWPESQRDKAKLWRGRFEIMTVSAHSRAAIQAASPARLDAVLCSTVFPSQSLSASRPLGAYKFRTLVASGRLPVYGLGGVESNNAGHIADIAGLAAISGLQDAFVD